MYIPPDGAYIFYCGKLVSGHKPKHAKMCYNGVEMKTTSDDKRQHCEMCLRNVQVTRYLQQVTKVGRPIESRTLCPVCASKQTIIPEQAESAYDGRVIEFRRPYYVTQEALDALARAGGS